MNRSDHFDVLVLGAGSAGCVLASRLSEAPDRTVCLVEAGPDYGSYASGRWPADLLDVRAAPRSHDWGFGDGDSLLRAKVVGGCSAHNACFVVWGEPADYDEWEALGNPGWAFAQFAPYLERAETMLGTRRVEHDEITPWQRAVIDAAGTLGFPLLPSLRESEPTDGITAVPINAVDGVRWNAAFAYLDRARDRPNLAILDSALVDRLCLQGDRAVGAIIRHGNRELTLAANVVVIAAGAYGSPAILLRSGVGPEPDLQRLGIPVQASLPGVGCHLVDHPGVGLRFALGEGLQQASARYAHRRLLLQDQCILKATSSHDLGGCASLHVVPRTSELEAGDGYRGDMGVFVLKPRASGSLRLASRDPAVLPVVDNGFLSDVDGHDVTLLVEGIGLVRRLAEARPIADAVGAALGRELSEGEESVLQFARHHVKGYDHPIGTCKMGPSVDHEAVVDGDCRLHGYDNVYVADASVMPTIPRANTHLSVLAIAERIAEKVDQGERSSQRAC